MTITLKSFSLHYFYILVCLESDLDQVFTFILSFISTIVSLNKKLIFISYLRIKWEYWNFININVCSWEL